MQVSVETTGALGRRMTVQVPAERVDQEVENRLRDMSRTARVDGFRPGKVPFSVVRQRYGRRVRDEVVGDVMQRTLQEALAQEKLRPAGGPQIEAASAEPGTQLEYTVSFEVYPEFELAALGEMKVTRPVVEVSDADVDAMIEKLRRQRMTWESAGRPAQSGDQVVVDFEGTVDGQPFSGNKAGNVPVEIGSNKLIDGFEEQLIGASAGDERRVEVTFPENYPLKEVAGKPAVFQVKVGAVNAPVLPALDDGFAAEFGVKEGGLEALRGEVRRNMEREVGQVVRAVVKEQVFEILLERNPIDVPTALVEEEVHRLAEQAGQRDADHGEMHARYDAQARRRVSLGLVIGELVRRNGITVDPARVRAAVEGIAASYEDPEQVVKWYYENREMLAGVEALALEEQVADWVSGQVVVEEKASSFDELMQSRQA